MSPIKMNACENHFSLICLTQTKKRTAVELVLSNAPTDGRTSSRVANVFGSTTYMKRLGSKKPGGDAPAAGERAEVCRFTPLDGLSIDLKGDDILDGDVQSGWMISFLYNKTK